MASEAPERQWGGEGWWEMKTVKQEELSMWA